MVIQERKMYLSIMPNQQNTCLVIKLFIHHTLTFSLEEAYNRFIKVCNALWCSRKCSHHCRMPFVEREHFTSDSVLGRKHHLEAYILPFIAENSLPLSIVPKLISFLSFCLEI